MQRNKSNTTPSAKRCISERRLQHYKKTPEEVVETPRKPLPAPHKKHSLGVCTVDIPLLNCHRRRNIVSWRDILFSYTLYSYACGVISVNCEKKSNVDESLCGIRQRDDANLFECVY